MGLLLLVFNLSNAQRSITVYGKAPDWGPSVTTERYYYIPDLETYYDVRSREYIYLNDGIWVRRTSLPTAYRNYDLYAGRKVIINDYSGNAPYVYYSTHKVKYVKSYKNSKANAYR